MRYRVKGQRYYGTEQLNNILKVGLVGHWTGGGSGKTWYDKSGYNNHGALNTSPVWTLGENNHRNAIQFVGTVDNGIDVTHSSTIAVAGPNITIASWVYLNAAPTSEQDWIGKWSIPAAARSYFQGSHYSSSFARILCGLSSDGGTTNWHLQRSVNAHLVAGWQHVVTAYNGTAWTIYYNGTSVPVENDLGSAQSSIYTGGTQPLRIGYLPGTSFNGKVDDVRIYNRTLSAAEVRLLFYSSANQVLPRKAHSFILPSSPSSSISSSPSTSISSSISSSPSTSVSSSISSSISSSPSTSISSSISSSPSTSISSSVSSSPSSSVSPSTSISSSVSSSPSTSISSSPSTSISSSVSSSPSSSVSPSTSISSSISSSPSTSISSSISSSPSSGSSISSSPSSSVSPSTSISSSISSSPSTSISSSVSNSPSTSISSSVSSSPSSSVSPSTSISSSVSSSPSTSVSSSASSSVSSSASSSPSSSVSPSTSVSSSISSSASSSVSSSISSSPSPAPSTRLKYWNGSSWVLKDIKYYTGSAWVVKPLKYWDGSTWS